jgi:o-succinylbenzoate synthase
VAKFKKAAAMNVDAVTLRELQIPLKHFFETSFGRVTHRRVLLVTVASDGVEGWAECVAAEGPFFSYEWIETAWSTIREFLAPALLGAKLESARASGALMARVRGHNMAKAALENALWDAEAKQNQQPLWMLLCGTRSEVACGVSIGIQNSHDQLLDKIEADLSAGYQRVKVKVKPGWDIDVLQKIRDRWPDIVLSCDANSAYTPADLEHLRKFEQFNLLMIEQPLWHDDICSHAELQRAMQTSICLDESIRHSRDAGMALELGACRIINIKVGRVGGFTEAIAVHNTCQKHAVPVWCGGMLETGIGRAHNVALSTLPNFSLPGDVSASKRYWSEDIIEPEIEVSSRGTIAGSNEAGLGYEIKKDLVERLTVRKETLEPSH